MFKSKIDFNAFYTHNDKVKDLEQSTVKALAKAAVKKLLAKPGERTSFHLLLDYFKDEKGNALGHFLGFGISKKLDKHFLQIEMKSGKLDKRISNNPKEASMGEAYIKKDGAKALLCFEPHPNSKIPAGKWPKILKSLKAYLNGIKAVVVIGGQIIGDDAANAAAAAPDAAIAPQEDTVNPQEDTVNPQEDTVNPQEDVAALAAQFKEQLEQISGYLKETLPKDILPKIKNKTLDVSDLEVVQNIKAKIDDFEAAYQNAAETLQSKLAKMRDSIAQQTPKVEKVLKAVEQLLGTNTGDDTTEDDATAIQELLDMAREGLAHFDSIYDQLKSDLENSKAEPLPSGAAFLEEVQ